MPKTLVKTVLTDDGINGAVSQEIDALERCSARAECVNPNSNRRSGINCVFAISGGLHALHGVHTCFGLSRRAHTLGFVCVRAYALVRACVSVPR